MERELVRKIFIIKDYTSKLNMDEDIKKYIEILKEKYPTAVITKEFYKGENILVRATYIEVKKKIEKIPEKERENEEFVRERGAR